MIKTKFSIAIHIMTLLAMYTDEWLSSTTIAGSLNINSVLVRKEIATLKEGHLVESKEGKNGGVRLLKPASQITLAQIFDVVLDADHVLASLKNKPSPDCKVGKQMNVKMDVILNNIDMAIYKELSKQTLETFKNQF